MSVTSPRESPSLARSNCCVIELQLKVAAFVVHSGEKHLSPSVFVVGFTTLGAVKEEEAEIALTLEEKKKRGRNTLY